MLEENVMNITTKENKLVAKSTKIAIGSFKYTSY